MLKMPTSFSDDKSVPSNKLASRSVSNLALISSTVGRPQVTDCEHSAVHRQHVAEILVDRVTVLVPCDHIAGFQSQ